MRYHGQARVSPRTPEAFAVCDRCGFLYNHVDLQWQFDWQGPRTQNLRILVCESCLDKPFEHNRTLILPPDPVAIGNARPENYVAADNPLSTILLQPLDAINGSNFTPVTPQQTGNIGNMIGGAGVDAPYAGAPQRLSGQGAMLTPSQAGLNNWIGKFWSAVPGLPTMILPGLAATAGGVKYGIGTFLMNAPNDQSFLRSGATPIDFYGFDGSAWHPVWTGSSAGTAGEVLTGTFTDQTPYYAHAVVVNGDGVTPAAIGYLQLNAVTHAINAALITDPSPPTTPANFTVFVAKSIQVGSPPIGQPIMTVFRTAVNLFPINFVDSSPLLGVPVLTTGATSAPISIVVGSPSFGVPVLVPSFVPMTPVNMASGSPILGVPVVSVGHQATGITVGSPTLGTPAINQKIPMVAVGIADASPQISVPTLQLSVTFSATTTSVSPIIGIPTENILGVTNPIPPATSITTHATTMDTVPAFSAVTFTFTSLTTKKAVSDNLPAFTP